MWGDRAALSLVWVLLCVVVIVGLAYWFTKFVAGRSGAGILGNARGAARMKVLARLPVGKDRELLLVQVETRYFLLGSAPGGITALTEFSSEEAAAWAAAGEPPEKGAPMSFGKALQTVIEQKKRGEEIMPEGLLSINGEHVQTLEILLFTTLITLLPSLLVMMTSFTRYIISFSFLRSAMGTQQTPPNMVLIGLALFLTLLTMSPVLDRVKSEAYDPYVEEEITQEEFMDRAAVPLKEFMLRNTETGTLDMFCDLAKEEKPQDEAAALRLPMRIVVPSFMTCELKRAFTIGFLLYIPFMLIDIVVSSTLMSMGMVMLPPSMISMPFKLLLFISINGWQLLFSTLIQSFR